MSGEADHWGRNMVLGLIVFGVVLCGLFWWLGPSSRAQYQEMYRLRWQDVGADRCYYRDADSTRLSCVRREP